MAIVVRGIAVLLAVAAVSNAESFKESLYTDEVSPSNLDQTAISEELALQDPGEEDFIEDSEDAPFQKKENGKKIVVRSYINVVYSGGFPFYIRNGLLIFLFQMLWRYIIYSDYDYDSLRKNQPFRIQVRKTSSRTPRTPLLKKRRMVRKSLYEVRLKWFILGAFRSYTEWPFNFFVPIVMEVIYSHYDYDSLLWMSLVNSKDCVLSPKITTTRFSCYWHL